MKNSNLPLFATVFVLLLIGVGGRIALHDYPNFETVMIATFLAAMLLPTSTALIVTISIMMISDIYLGYFGNSKIIIFTYTGFLILSIVTSKYKNKIQGKMNAGSVYKFTATGILFAAIYDTWTNFGVFWLSYHHSLENLALVYILGLPFMLYHLLSNIITFTLIAFPLYYILTSSIKDKNTNGIGQTIDE